MPQEKMSVIVSQCDHKLELQEKSAILDFKKICPAFQVVTLDSQTDLPHKPHLHPSKERLKKILRMMQALL